ncbi:Hypothetical_protein [Hexamita inflata]|uniref:Hypothetical_protein n=1 Tax=Hexamita inflata TaxID=28002 RepID=A0AA86NR68_9EUKA|nr:Hypothetical protein HINF_LOCUS10991 [Hexamita inflata]
MELYKQVSPERFWAMYLKQSRELERLQQQNKELTTANENLTIQVQNTIIENEEFKVEKKQLQSEIGCLKLTGQLQIKRLVDQENALVKLSQVNKSSNDPELLEPEIVNKLLKSKGVNFNANEIKKAKQELQEVAKMCEEIIFEQINVLNFTVRKLEKRMRAEEDDLEFLQE